MGTYRAYCYDGRGKVWVEDRLPVETDEDAINAALGIDAAVRLEVREDHRVVRVIDRRLSATKAQQQSF